jgi:hypothetical protein
MKSNLLINQIFLDRLILFLLFLLILFSFSNITPNHWFGFFILVLTYFIPTIIKPFNRNKKILFSAFIGITIHHIIAFYNGFIGPTYGATADASRFFKNATFIYQYSNDYDFSIGSNFYESILAIFLKFFGDSKFVASELSVLFFVFSLIILGKILLLLDKEKYLYPIVLLFSLLPSNFLFTSVTLREPFEMFFFMLSCYLSVFYIKTKKISALPILVISLLLLGVWHNGLIIFLPNFALFFIIFSMDGKRKRYSLGLKFILFLLYSILIFFTFILITKLGLSSQASTSLINGDIMDYSQDYRDVEYSGGSSYSADFSSVFSIPILFLNYMFAPFPWQIRNILDIYAAFESILRLVLIFYAFTEIKNRKKGKRETKTLLFLFLVSLVLEFIWSMGTLNWGTAMRHHIMAYGIFLILGIEGLSNKFKRKGM